MRVLALFFVLLFAAAPAVAQESPDSPVQAGITLLDTWIETQMGFGVTSDINRWLKRRDDRRRQHLQLECTHVTIEKDSNRRSYVDCLLDSQSTGAWICSRCHLITYDNKAARHVVHLALENPVGAIGQEERFTGFRDAI